MNQLGIAQCLTKSGLQKITQRDSEERYTPDERGSNRAAAAAKMGEENRPPALSHHKRKSHRLSDLIRGVGRHRRGHSESALLSAIIPRDSEDETTLLRTRSATHATSPDRERAERRPPVFDPSRLYDQLLAALTRAPRNNQDFLSIRNLDNLVTQTSVDRELSRKAVYLPTKIWRRTFRLSVDVRIDLPLEEEGVQNEQAGRSYDGTRVPPERACYKQIFAVLLFIGQPSRIWSFVDQQVSDADLPLGPGNDILGLRRNLPRKCLIWPRDRSRFLKCQWWVLAPFFWGLDGRKFSHLKAPKDLVIPFTSWEDTGREGGFGRVYKAKIHPHHHNFDRTKVNEHRHYVL